MRALAMAAALLLAALAGRARADHDMSGMGMPSDTATASAIGVGVSMLAASYSSTYYVGSYQGLVPTASYARGRWSAMAMVGLYHIEENGLDVYGVGDAMVSGSVALVDDGPWRAGLTVAATLPTGQMDHGLGMGNAMLMPSLWATRGVGPFALAASAGYTRGLAALDTEEHGLWPLVDPMNMSELAWRASATWPATAQLVVGVSARGGVPIDQPMGVDYAIGAAGASWTTPRTVTGLDVEAGLAGDPVSVRAIVTTAVRF